MSDENVAGLADDLYDVIGLLRRRSRRLVGAPLPELALSGAQLELMRVVRRNPGITVAESARVLGLAANTVSTLVGQLLALEVLLRERDASDRRVARLDLTPSARAGLEQWRDRRAQATAVALEGLPADERARLAAALPTIARIAADLPVTPAVATTGPSDPALAPVGLHHDEHAAPHVDQHADDPAGGDRP
ncbi:MULTISPECIES: MarR family winged helix-turn-helix transcriptional regulator [unclassified Terrabacter]|uniref:MarR family winged helix-turn-helix transcriptional regulator n=1 Tax=unclassified Terrabacter TaxID=2630222 RepID=UPI00070179FA|nr:MULTISPECIES: MarR family transcriptional regulator [unclassified Terrabacter]KRB45509.1 transcriptional regulator [Terrabacter sp. Root181]KRF41359.1 transcriptional regulator [Terrabacter sp. Soil810]